MAHDATGVSDIVPILTTLIQIHFTFYTVASYHIDRCVVCALPESDSVALVSAQRSMLWRHVGCCHWLRPALWQHS